jgi:hypothetical protein
MLSRLIAIYLAHTCVFITLNLLCIHVLYFLEYFTFFETLLSHVGQSFS